MAKDVLLPEGMSADSLDEIVEWLRACRLLIDQWDALTDKLPDVALDPDGRSRIKALKAQFETEQPDEVVKVWARELADRELAAR